MSRLALLAAVALALLPTLSHALNWAQGGKTVWTEVCTPQGMKLIAVDAGSAPGSMPASMHLEHCPYCSLGANAAIAPPPALPLPALLPAATTEHPPRFYQAATTPHVWRTAQPRGPPVSHA